MRSWRGLMMGVLPIAVAAAGFASMSALSSMREEPQTQPTAPPPPVVRVVEAHPRDVQLSVMAHGTVVPRTEADLTVEVSGQVQWVSPELANGGFFEAGATLLRLDARDYELALAQAKLEVSRAERRLAEEQADAEVARREWSDLGTGQPSPLVLHEPQLAEAQAALTAAQASVARASRDLARTEIQAPFAGRVRSKQADVGQFLARGTPVARVYAVDWAEVRLPLPDRDLAYLDLSLDFRGEAATRDQPAADLWCDFAGRRHRWPARIVRTEGEIDPRTGMVVAVARVEDPYARGTESDRPPLAVGMFVEAEIFGRAVHDAYVLPRAVLRSSDRLYVMDDQDRLRFRTVEVLRASQDEVVLGAGLIPGERVVISPLEVATDGMRLALDESAQARP